MSNNKCSIFLLMTLTFVPFSLTDISSVLPMSSLTAEVNIFSHSYAGDVQNFESFQNQVRKSNESEDFTAGVNLSAELIADNLSAPTNVIFLDGGNILVTEESGHIIWISQDNNTSNSAPLNSSQSSVTVDKPIVNQPISVNTTTIDKDLNRNITSAALMHLKNDNPSSCIKNQGNAYTINNSTDHDGYTADSRRDCEEDTNRDFLFLYVTTLNSTDKNSDGTFIYRYELNENTRSISNKSIILALPSARDSTHGSTGRIITDHFDHLYVTVGDQNKNGTLQNQEEPPFYLDGTSVILKVNYNGSPLGTNPFKSQSETEPAAYNLSRYYAYGIKESRGLAIDPDTGNLWDYETYVNGYDEVNIVLPGFNSGWSKISGPMQVDGNNKFKATLDDLVNLGNGSTYSDPAASWAHDVELTDIEFLNSSTYGDKYANELLAGDQQGNVYLFELNETRNGIVDHDKDSSTALDNQDTGLSSGLAVVSHGHGHLFANIPGKISDLVTGRDGFLYVLTSGGEMYRLVPNDQS